MQKKRWLEDVLSAPRKKAFPILSFPSAPLLGVTVRELIQDGELQAKGMQAVAQRCDTLAAVGMMDLSVEAEAFGASIRAEDHEVPTVVGRLVATQRDADELAVPPVGAGRTALYVEGIAQARRLIADRPVFAGMIGPFSLGGRLMDLSEIMVNCYDQPDMVHTCLAKVTRFLIEYGKAFKAAGASGIVMAEPAAGLLSPALIAEFSTPYVRQVREALSDDTFAFIYHNCGRTLPLIGSILQIGADAYHFGNAVDIHKMLELIPDDVLVMGNIDPAGQFRNGTPESMRAATLGVLEECASHPNFIISSGCDIPPLAPWENIDAFFKAVADFYVTA